MVSRCTDRPVALVIDEIDGTPRQVSYIAHSMMVNQTITWRGQTFGLCPLIIIGTSNRMSGVPPAMRSRFAETLHLDYYGPGDLAVMAEREAAKRRVALGEGVARFLAENAGGEDRKVGHLVRALRNVLRGRRTATMEDARQALGLSGLRRGGLDRQQRKYVEFLAESPNQTSGVGSIAAFLGTDGADVVGAVEPYLVRSRMVRITPRGRQLAERGRTYLEDDGGLRRHQGGDHHHGEDDHHHHQVQEQHQQEQRHQGR